MSSRWRYWDGVHIPTGILEFHPQSCAKFESFGKPHLPLRSRWTWHQQWLDMFFPVKKKRLLDVPLRFCWFRLYSKVLLPALVALYTESATVCSNNMNHLFCFPSFWLIYTIFHPQSLLPFTIPSHFNLELCLLGSASCERKETSMPSSWPRVSRRMISKPCWAETWTWMRHRGEEAGCRFWFWDPGEQLRWQKWISPEKVKNAPKKGGWNGIHSVPLIQVGEVHILVRENK